jgi:hypothetical protein
MGRHELRHRIRDTSMTRRAGPYARGGKDSIDHAPLGHDDVANAAAGVLVLVKTGVIGSVSYSSDLPSDGKSPKFLLLNLPQCRARAVRWA